MDQHRILKTDSMIVMSVSFDNENDMYQQKETMEELANIHKDMLSEVFVIRNTDLNYEDNIYTYSELSIKKFVLN